MTNKGREFAKMRHELRMSRRELGEIFGLKQGAIEDRETGATKIKPIDWMAMLYLKEGGDTESRGTPDTFRKLRIDWLALTQGELAQEMGITTETLSRLELGRNQIRPYVWFAMKYLAKRG